MIVAAVLLLMSGAARAEDATVPVKVRPVHAAAAAASSEESDDAPVAQTEIIDAPTSAVIDDHAFSTRSRFYSAGGLLEYFSFGVYPGVNLGVSAAVDSLIGDQSDTRVRAPSVQVKYRFYEGTQTLPSWAVGYDGQGYGYNVDSQRFNQRQRGVYVVASKELGLPGLEIHPSLNISDFNSNSVFGSLPLTWNIRDKAALLVEWDNIADWSDSRFNAGVRAFVTPDLHVTFAARAIGAGGRYSDGSPKGPERIVEPKYVKSF